MADWRSLYSLNRFQAHEFRHRCDIYLVQEPTIDPVTKERKGRGYNPTPDFTNVPCHHIATDDFELVAVEGQGTENNIMTQDHFHFHILQPVGTNARIHWQPAPGVGGMFTVQGRGKPSPSLGRMVIDSNVVYAKLGV